MSSYPTPFLTQGPHCSKDPQPPLVGTCKGPSMAQNKERTLSTVQMEGGRHRAYWVGGASAQT